MSEQSDKEIKQREARGALIKKMLLALMDLNIDRYLQINPQRIIGAHYFAEASSQCLYLYRDGHFLSAVMVSHAVNESIIKFVAERNSIQRDSHEEMIEELVDEKVISEECAEASRRIWKSFRNDIHHMNPKVAEIPFEMLAKRNIEDLAIIEKEIFGVDIAKGRLSPHQPKYWDGGKAGTVQGFIRM